MTLVGKQGFNEQLSDHVGHRVEIVVFKDYSTEQITDYQLRCTEKECDSPVGIAVEFVSQP